MSTPESILQFQDESLVARDLNITEDQEGDFYLGVNNRASVTPIHSTAASVSVGQTTNIYNQVAAANTRIKKIVCTGQTDGFFKLKVNGSVVAMGKTSPTEYTFNEDFAGCVLFVAAGATITLEVKNTGIVTADFEGIIYTSL